MFDENRKTLESHDPSHGTVEPDEPPSFKLGVLLVVLVGVVAVSAVLVKSLMYWAMAHNSNSDTQVIGSALLRDTNAEALAKITNYSLISAEKGIYQIPVDQAISEMVRLQSSVPFSLEK